MDQINRVIGLLKKGDKILLGEKTEGIGKGNYVAVGGKQKKGESLEQTLLREMQEEIGVKVLNYQLMAQIRFEFEQKKEWNQTVYVCTCNKWEGTPQGSKEISPEWFDSNMLPYTGMWEDAFHWYPFVLSDRKINAYFKYGADNKNLVETNIKVVKSVDEI